MIFKCQTNIKVTAHELKHLKIHALKGNNVFNPDNKRYQNILSTHRIKKKLREFLIEHKWLRNRSMGTTVVMHSKAQCAKQHWHTDFDPDMCKSAQVKPLGVLFALQDNTSLNIHKRKKIDLKRGEMLLFSGDVIHAGSHYDNENTRIHIYLDSNEVKRQRNKTFIIK